MEPHHFLYLGLNIGTILVPFIRSFEPRIQFFKDWKYLFPAIGITGLFFLVWDVFFEHAGIWGFNDFYLLGPRLFGLPLEEYLFFLTVPYACLFIYAVLKYFVKAKWMDGHARGVTLVLAVVLAFAGILFRDQTYTFWNFMFTSAFLLLFLLFGRKMKGVNRFYITFLIALIPFLLVNGALTGFFTPEPVVWYNDAENFGIRIGTIPIEDTVYGFLLLFMNWVVYQGLKFRKHL